MKKVLLCCFLLVLGLTGCGKKEEKLSSIIVSFNPEFLVSFDENRIVKEIKALNEDSKIYLTDELLNLEVDDFVDKFVEVSQENGYLKEKDVEVTIKSYEGDSKEVVEEIKTNLKTEYKIESKEIEITEEEKEKISVNVEKAEKIVYKELSEEEKKEEETRKAEELRKAEETKKAEELRKAEETKKAEEAKKVEEEKKAEEEKTKYDYNLNKSNVLDYQFFTTQQNVYPQNSECIGKEPWNMTIPEGETYNSFCNNTIPSFKSVVKGKGYYCKYLGNNVSTDMSISGEYECYVITSVVKADTISKKITKIINIKNAIPVSGGRGSSDKLTLTEALCTKYSLSCGRW